MSTENGPSQSTVVFKSDKIKYTPSGAPYLTLPPTSAEPLYITPLYKSDPPSLQELLSDATLSDNLYTAPKPYTLADAEFFVNLSLSNSQPGRIPLQVIRASSPDEDGALIGSVSLASVISKKDGPMAIAGAEEGEYEVGYFLHPKWRGQGIMTVALRTLVVWAREELGAQAIVRVAEDNLASRKVVENMPEWELVSSRSSELKWPENKGGGVKKLRLWKWKF